MAERNEPREPRAELIRQAEIPKIALAGTPLEGFGVSLSEGLTSIAEALPEPPGGNPAGNPEGPRGLAFPQPPQPPLPPQLLVRSPQFMEGGKKGSSTPERGRRVDMVEKDIIEEEVERRLRGEV